MMFPYVSRTVRYIILHRTSLSINLTGLASALAVAYFAFIYVSFELSYDTFHEHGADIYRLVTDVESDKGIDYQGSSAPVAAAVETSIPDVAASVRILLDYLIMQNDQGIVNEERIAYADPSVFSVFTFPLVAGDSDKVLNAPFQMVITQSAAARYFGNKNPIGQYLWINGKDRAYVTGVMEDIPANAHFRVDIIVSMPTLLQEWNPAIGTNWLSHRFYTYLLIPDKQAIPRVTEGIARLMQEHNDRPGTVLVPSLEPLTSLYLHAKARGHRAGSSVTGSAGNLVIFSAVACLVLVVACLNYVNLTTAFSLRRVKEIGVRKAFGASRAGLVFQFLNDAAGLGIVACILALSLVSLLLPYFNQLCGKEIATSVGRHLPLFVVASVVISVAAGLYPSLFLSGIGTKNALKGRVVWLTRGIRLRQVLVAAQFAVSFFLLVSTAVIFSQLRFMQTRDPGFQKDHFFVIDFQFDAMAGSEFVRRELSGVPGVSSASISSSIPGRPNARMETIVADVNGDLVSATIDTYFVDFGFAPQYALELVAGRYFSPTIASDSTGAMMVNQSMVRLLGYANPEEIVGKTYVQAGRKGYIIGVVKDFHFQSLREEVQPLSMQIGERYTFMTLALSSNDLPATVSNIERRWKEINPDFPLVYFFLDDGYHAMYLAERRFASLFVCLVVVALIVSCLGLVGLSVFSTAQRAKEVGIRKVMGSSSTKIVSLLAKDFLGVIGVSMVITTPVAWLILSQWLRGYAYRIDLSPVYFFAASIVLTAVALSAIAFHTLQAANMNPVKTLRTD